jgi:hypothetical protein
MNTRVVNVQRVTTEECFRTKGTGITKEPGEVDGLHVVPREAAPCAREVIAEFAVKRLPAVFRLRFLPNEPPEVLVGRVGCNTEKNRRKTPGTVTILRTYLRCNTDLSAF